MMFFSVLLTCKLAHGKVFCLVLLREAKDLVENSIQCITKI